MPIGDQSPWIEVGEHVIGSKLSRFLNDYFQIRDCGIPSGPDERFVLSGSEIKTACGDYTNSCWLFPDIKSVGPRDNQEHIVMSHNQISGDGIWEIEEEGVKNSPIKAKGKLRLHNFHCAIPPLYVLSDGTVAPVVEVVIKIVYEMLTLKNPGSDGGQPLKEITVVTIPNGILLTENPGYLSQYPNLFFPGKDDQSKNPLKVRARVSFKLLKTISPWRIVTIKV